MVQIDGKYQLTKTDNFLELVSGQGTQEAERLNKAHSLLTVSKEGNKVTISDISGDTPLTRIYIIGEANEEELIKGVKAQTTVTLEGSKLVLNSRNASEVLQRVYEFSDDGLTILSRPMFIGFRAGIADEEGDPFTTEKSSAWF